MNVNVLFHLDGDIERNNMMDSAALLVNKSYFDRIIYHLKALHNWK